MKHFITTILFIAAFFNTGFAFSIESTRFHCAEDTAKINHLLSAAALNRQLLKTPNDYMSFFANQFREMPYVAHTLEGDSELLTINVDQFDCTTFVETLIALTKAAMTKNPTWYSYAAQLENIRYRGGELNGYPSRLHYISAWIVDNTARGNLREITSSLPHSENIVKTLNYMSEHRDSYSALSDDATFDAIKSVEAGYNMHLFPYINKKNLKKKDLIEELKDGDIIALTTKIEGLDASHMGIIQFIGGKPHLLHASSDAMCVVLDDNDLFEMLRRLRNNTGIRVIRLTDNF